MGGRACKPDSPDESPISQLFCKLLKYKRWQQALDVNYGNRGNPENNYGHSLGTVVWGAARSVI
jgi:hypothetical protein